MFAEIKKRFRKPPEWALLIFVVFGLVGFIYESFFLPSFVIFILIYTVVTLTLGIIVIVNRYFFGGLLFFAGTFCNWLVITVNGAMPVSLVSSEVGNLPTIYYEYINDDTILPILADIFSFRKNIYYSIGDVLIIMGLALIVLQFIYLMTKYKISEKKEVIPESS